MIAAFKGRSANSRAIIFCNDGEHSHVAWIDDETGDVWEAWTSGVRRVKSVHHDHTPGTVVEIFSVAGETHERTTAIRHFMISQEGKPYDWSGVLRFVTRGKERDVDNPPHWFCSRLVACAYRKAGIRLLNAPDWKMNPTDCTYSIRCPVVPVRSMVTIDVSIPENQDVRGYERGPSENLYLIDRE